MKKKYLQIFIVAFLFLVIAFITYSFLTKQKKSITKKRAPHQSALHFHPDQVLEINFLIQTSRFNFKRAHRLTFWTSDVNKNKKIHLILNELASLSSPLVNPVLKNDYQIDFKTDDYTKWGIISDGEKFIWTEGPLKTKGGILTKNLKSYFIANENMFLTKMISLCEFRPVQFQSQKSTLKYIKNAWHLNNKLYSKQNQIEKWLGKNCKKKAQSILSDSDKKTELTKFSYNLNIIDTKNKNTQINWSDTGFIKIEQNNTVTFIYDEALIDQLNILSLYLSKD